jgi:signal transduction histidine kinase
VPIVPEILRAKVSVFVELFRQTRQLARLNRELEERVEERTAALEEANRRKDQFLAVLSHELRNPLAAIRTAAELMATPELGTEAQGQATGVIRRQVAQLARLVEDLVDVSRITRGSISLQRQHVLVSTFIANATEASRPLMDARQHSLTVHIADPSLMVDGDPARLSQIVGNLLNNSAKFTAPGGHIFVEVVQQGARVAIRVKDNGIGIPPEQVPRIFGLFTQVEGTPSRTGGGLGIGLALVQQLVEMHGGFVRIYSEGLGRGTEVFVSFPLITGAPAGDAAATQDMPAKTALPPCRILVADDNQDAATSLELLLRTRGHDVRTAADGLEAVQAVEAFSPRVVLLDLGMPRLDGYETARRIRQQPNGRDCVLIALTGWGQPQDRRRTLDAGFDAHLVKPVGDGELFATLSALTGS